MISFLRQHEEEMPDWLGKYKPNDSISFDMVMSSRIGYYPGSGFDGNLIVVANKAHCVHSFLYVDYSFSKEEVISRLFCTGYHSIGRVDWREQDLMPNGQFPITVKYTSRCNPMMLVNKSVTPYCFTEIFERNPERDDDWGAARFAVTCLFADGIATYFQLFVKQYAKAPWLFLLQDHGWGLNYDKFGKGGYLDAIMRSSNLWPDYVICDLHTRIWNGYHQIENVENTFWGMHHTERGLYRRS